MHRLRTISSNSRRNENHFANNRLCGMLLIRYTCGTEILLIPDIKGMNRAIENHVGEHKKTNLRIVGVRVSPNLVRQGLVEQILQKASGIC